MRVSFHLAGSTAPGLKSLASTWSTLLLEKRNCEAFGYSDIKNET